MLMPPTARNFNLLLWLEDKSKFKKMTASPETTIPPFHHLAFNGACRACADLARVTFRQHDERVAWDLIDFVLTMIQCIGVSVAHDPEHQNNIRKYRLITQGTGCNNRKQLKKISSP
ncbi:10820_t:CDS:1 [Paraglomus brasilianum]|uniref:10820_t:CDS:1 n=1 Tax=Paraglomus brasilianum TaxID=144538 RepID=A0A9N9DRH4_9GLOM|nr:10820_t:CDS:1 [Paraglomus brasilianum]